MKNYKKLIKTGSIMSGLALLLLIYNFFNMYSIPGKCPERIDVQPCQTNNNWILLNRLGFIILAIGVVILIISFMKRRQQKP